MADRSEFSVALVTTPSPEEGRRIARAVLELRLAACASLVSGLQSIFWWQGKLDEAEETLIVFKTKQEALPRLIEEIKRLHSYTVCEVLAVPVTAGNPAYLDWIEETVRP